MTGPRILHVELAEAPRDVLVHLVDAGPTESLALLRSVAPDESDESKLALGRALGLLVEIGYVHPPEPGPWRATRSGVNAVKAGRAAADVTS